jgi:enoyl-CoA hydratase
MLNSILVYPAPGEHPAGTEALGEEEMSLAERRVTALRHGPVGILELSRPAVFNCLSLQGFAEMLEGLRGFEADSGIRAVLIRAQGKHFCTGAELGEVQQVRTDPESLAHFIAQGHAALRALEMSPLPVVAAVQGLCLAGGLELMLACDVVLAGASARFGDQHAQYGLVPGWGGTQRLPRAIGLRRALDLMFSARWISAEEAERWGLVNRVVEDAALPDEALAFCQGLSERSRPGLALMKRLAREEATLEAGLASEARAIVPALLAPDVTEGLAAFEARRKPVFG